MKFFVWSMLLIFCLLFWIVLGWVIVANATEFGTSQPQGFKPPGIDRVYLDAPTDWSKVNDSAVVSFKLNPAQVVAGQHDAMLRHWFRSAPDYRIWWSYWHEPENDGLNPKTYRQAWRHISAIEHETRNKLSATLILMHRSLDPGYEGWVDRYWPGRKAIDVMAFEGYNRKSERGYASPASIYGPGLASAKAHGVPYAVAEWGSVIWKGDTSGRASWITHVGHYLTKHHTRFAIYWNSLGEHGDYRLTDRPSQYALQSLIERSSP